MTGEEWRGGGGTGEGMGGRWGFAPPFLCKCEVEGSPPPIPPPRWGVGGGGGKREVEMEAVHRDERNEQTTVGEVDEIEQI